MGSSRQVSTGGIWVLVARRLSMGSAKRLDPGRERPAQHVPVLVGHLSPRSVPGPAVLPHSLPLPWSLPCSHNLFFLSLQAALTHLAPKHRPILASCPVLCPIYIRATSP